MKKLLKLFVFLLCVASVSAQTPTEIEQNLVKLYAKVSDNSGYKGNADYDVLGKANDDFKAKVLEYTKIASTLKYNFRELNEEITITTSEDGKFRAFSWDRLDGGTMHFFETVYQFQGADGEVYSKSRESEEGDPGSFVYDVFTVDTKAGKIYLVCTTSIGSTQDSYQTLRLFKVGKNDLNDDVKLIKTNSGLTDSIGFGYNFFSVVDRKERPIKLFVYDKKTKTFKFPVVIEDEKFMNGRVTDKFISYKFNGTHFEKVK